MTKYSWLFFDLDNTILDFSAASKLAFFDTFNKLGKPLCDKDYEKYLEINHQVWVDYEKGLLSADILKVKRWELFLDELDIDHDPSAINEDYFSYIGQNPIYVPDAKAVIDELKKDFKLACITNGLAEVQLPRLRITGLDKIFQPIVISEQIGVAKPAEAFFKDVHLKTDQPLKEEVLVIGDSLTSDIRGGINFGYDTCWFNFKGIENMTEYHATYEIDKLLELLDILY